MTGFVARSRKAVVGGIAAAAAIAPSVADVTPDVLRYGAVAGAFVVGFAMVWLTPNATE